MLTSLRKSGGRYYAALVWIAGLTTLIMGGVFLLFMQTPVMKRDWTALATIVGGYFVAMGIMGVASMGPNSAERLPGVREYRGQYRGHGVRPDAFDRRASDAEEVDERI